MAHCVCKNEVFRRHLKVSRPRLMDQSAYLWRCCRFASCEEIQAQLNELLDAMFPLKLIVAAALFAITLPSSGRPMLCQHFIKRSLAVFFGLTYSILRIITVHCNNLYKLYKYRWVNTQGSQVLWALMCLCLMTPSSIVDFTTFMLPLKIISMVESHFLTKLRLIVGPFSISGQNVKF